MSDSLSRRHVALGMVWGAVEIYAGQLLQFVIGIFLARRLMPAQYGTFAILGVVIAIGQVFIDSGLSQALVRKKDITRLDCSTVYLTNLAVSLLCYAIAFFTAPLLSLFYRDPVLVPALRVMSLTLIIGSLGGVMRTLLVKDLQFKRLALISLVAAAIAGISAIAMAYNGWGVWALVAQNLIMVTITTLWIFIQSTFRPAWAFSRQSFRELFGFGSKMLGSSIIWTLFNNLYAMTIGRVMNAAALGIFSRADGYSRLLPSNISQLIIKVLYPVIAKLQDNDLSRQRLFTRAQSLTAFYVFGACSILAALAYPLIINLISQKWAACVPLLQIMLVGAALEPVSQINAQFLIADGHSGAFLKMHAIVLPAKLILLIVTLPFGLIPVAIGQSIVWGLEWLVSAFYFHRYEDIQVTPFYKVALLIALNAIIVALTGIFAFRCFLLPSWGNMLVTFIILVATYLLLGLLMYPRLLRDAMKVWLLLKNDK